MTDKTPGTPPVRGATAPTTPLPAGAWETHSHVFGPFDRYPLIETCPYVPPLAPQDEYMTMLDTAGFRHGVLIHAAATGFDMRATLDAVAQAPERLLCVGVVPEDTSDSDLAELHSSGMRGLRYTEIGESIGGSKPAGVLGFDALRRMAPRLAELGWHAHIWARCRHLAESASWLANCGVNVVIDHMGDFDVTRGVDDGAFQALLDLLSTGSIWIKLTHARVTRLARRDASDVRPYFDTLCRRNPQRLIWGSDWPYIALDDDLPSVGEQIDQFDAWTDESLRQQVFVDNPQRLYRHA